MRASVFFALLALALSPWTSPPWALAAGISFALLLGNPYPSQTKAATQTLLQASVVGLGFGMDLARVAQAGAGGFFYTAGGIAFALGAGALLGRWLGVRRQTAFLISAGTAICGGSAIAAVGPVIEADADEMAVSLGTVFILNSAALLAFPAAGAALDMTQAQFGLWAALAIHDTSSVVGASVRYGPEALAVGTTVKLARALWIVPLTLGAAAWRGSKAKVQWPWFILFFLAAAALRSAFPQAAPAFSAVQRLAKAGLTATLFLIGSGLSRTALAKVGARPLLQGVLLWALVAGVSLAVVMSAPSAD